MYDDELKTKGNKFYAKDKIEPQHIHQQEDNLVRDVQWRTWTDLVNRRCQSDDFDKARANTFYPRKG